MSGTTEATVTEASGSNNNSVVVEGKKSGCLWRGCLSIIVIIILIILLLLFCAVPKHSRVKKKATPAENAKTEPSKGIVGDARYEDLSVLKIYTIGRKSTTSKGAFIVLRFKLINVSSSKQVADLFMFRLKDSGGRLYQPDIDLTERYYEQRGQSFRWPQDIKGGGSIPVEVVFDTMRGMNSFKLVAKGFDLTVDKFITLSINNYSERGKPVNLMPANPQ